LHTEHDADGNGALSSDEFATLFAEVTRGMAERPFTMLDADDDGEISAEEMAFPAQMMARMQRMHGTDTDQQ
ncbi:MAG: calcium-binding protein, partial [Salibaculum sp.]|nr:calcium-binding protein [Salibaculum sp.]